jgi:hypothetical protein
MNSEDIDDLFRQKLDGHASPPSDDLWARLELPGAATEPEAEPLDTLFRAGLHGHATPPRRELWERLEDEHLRPQPRRRVAAWRRYSAAAVLLLLLLAGGAGLWRGAVGPKANNVATTRPATKPPLPAHAAPAIPRDLAPAAHTATTAAPQADQTLARAATTSKKNQQFFSTQATAPQVATSSTPMATTTQPRRAATAGRAAGSHRQRPDAAAAQLATTGKRRPAGQPQPTPAPTLAVATPAADIIEVEVRRGPAPALVAPPALVAAADAAPTRRPRLRLGGLLRQADRLVHGESVNLAEATDLPETVTVQARLGGRLLSKTIQL